MNARHNILIILSDEQRYDTLGCTGNGVAQTPHIDELADRGVVADRCYTPFPLCCPARASLWTSRTPRGHHVIGNWRAIRPELRDGGLVADFADAGYHTLYSGKWHVPGTTPARIGFRDSSAIPAVLKGRDRGRYIEAYRSYASGKGYDLVPGMIENLTESDLRQLEGSDTAPCGRAEIALEHYIDTWQTEQFLKTLEARPADAPFFAVVSYSAPHFPMIVPEPYDRLVRPDELELPPNFLAPVVGKPQEIQQSHYRTDYTGLDESEWRRLAAHYHGFCALVDTQVGKIMRHLTRANLDERTIVIYTSDHGDMMGSHGMFQKGHPMHYEETNHIPLIVSHPDTTACTRTNRFVTLTDIMPTLAELCDVTLTSETEGRSFAHLLTDASGSPVRRHVVSETYLVDGEAGGHGEYTDPDAMDEERLTVNMSIRDASWKYVYHMRDQDELYDLLTDPWEMVNLAGSTDTRPEETRMREALIKDVRVDSPRLADMIATTRRERIL